MLNPSFVTDTRITDFAKDKRLRLTDAFAGDTASRLADVLQNAIAYDMMVAPGGVFQALSAQTLKALPQPRRQELLETLHTDAKAGRGFVYMGHRLETTANAALKVFHEQINSQSVLDQFRALTGNPAIKGADAQATRYDPGHYLTRHLDDPADEKRLYAYVFSFNRTWHPDWGGLLQFYEKNGTPRDAWAPGMNTLSLFEVSHVHAVTYIAPFAGQSRFSITGWLHG